MAKSNQSPNNKNEKYKTQRWVVTCDLLGKAINVIPMWTALTLISYFTYLSIDSLSGKQTTANVIVSFLSDLKMSQWFAYAAAAILGTTTIMERKQRRKQVAELTNRNRELELIVDKSRSSSKLPITGKTRKEDL